VANLLLVVDEDATTHDVRQRYSCPKCKAVGNNTYKILWGCQTHPSGSGIFYAI